MTGMDYRLSFVARVGPNKYILAFTTDYYYSVLRM
jgi:hypothetical protein